MLIATFVFGFVSGTILFLFNYQGDGSKSGFFDDHATISITAYRYGGCARANGCASYRIADTGDYTYIVRDNAGGEVRFNGILSTAEKNELFKILRNTTLSNLQESVFSGTCPAEYDGTAYRYTIVYNDERYQFDTCRQELDDSTLFVALTEYFEVFKNAHDTH